MLPLLEKEKTWTSPKEWKTYINKLPLGINIASFIGHSDIRMKAMGIARSLKDNESATKEEEKQMFIMLNDPLDEGFIGLSTMDNPWIKWMVTNTGQIRHRLFTLPGKNEKVSSNY